MSDAQRSRPSPKDEAATRRLAAHPQDTNPAPAPHLSRAEIDASMPGYILVVKSVAGRVSRRPYLSLNAAAKAIKRAQARGHAASLELVRVVPYTVAPEVRAAGDRDE